MRSTTSARSRACGATRRARDHFTKSLELRRRLGIADEADMTLTLRRFVEILLKDVAGARAGAAHAMFESTAQHPAAMWRRFLDPLLAPARATLSPEAVERAMDEQALRYALEKRQASTVAG